MAGPRTLLPVTVSVDALPCDLSRGREPIDLRGGMGGRESYLPGGKSSFSRALDIPPSATTAGAAGQVPSSPFERYSGVATKLSAMARQIPLYPATPPAGRRPRGRDTGGDGGLLDTRWSLGEALLAPFGGLLNGLNIIATGLADIFSGIAGPRFALAGDTVIGGAAGVFMPADPSAHAEFVRPMSMGAAITAMTGKKVVEPKETSYLEGVEETSTTIQELLETLATTFEFVLGKATEDKYFEELVKIEVGIIFWRNELAKLGAIHGRDRAEYEVDIRIGENILLDRILRLGADIFSEERAKSSVPGLKTGGVGGTGAVTGRERPAIEPVPADAILPSLVNHDVGYGRTLALRGHQAEVLGAFKGRLQMMKALGATLREEQLRGTVVMPTGSGKTRVMVAFLAAMIESGLYKPGDKFVILNHTTQIHEQNMEVAGLLSEYFNQVFERALKVTEYKAENRDLTGDVVIVSIPTVNTEARRAEFDINLREELDGNSVRMVAIDEVHHLEAAARGSKGSWRELLKTLRAISPQLYRAGFTATPTGREGAYIAMVKELSLIRSGVLPRTYVVRVDSGIDLSAVKVNRTGEEFSAIDLENTLLAHPDRNARIYQQLEAHGMRDGPGDGRKANLRGTLVFAVDLNHAKMMAEGYAQYFANNGGGDLRGRRLTLIGDNRGKIHKRDFDATLEKYSNGEIDAIVAIVSGSTSRDILKEILSAVERGEIEAVFNVDVLSEGADLHMFSHLVGARPTFSTIRKGQERGRVNRRGPEDVTRDGQILNDRPKIIFDVEDRYSSFGRSPIYYRNLMGISMSNVAIGELYDVVAGSVADKVDEKGEGITRETASAVATPPARQSANGQTGLVGKLREILEAEYASDTYLMALALGITEENLKGMLKGNGWINARWFLRRLATLLYQERVAFVDIYNAIRELGDESVTSDDIAIVRGAITLYREWETGDGEIVINGDDGFGEREENITATTLHFLNINAVGKQQWRSMVAGLCLYFGIKAGEGGENGATANQKSTELTTHVFKKMGWEETAATAKARLLLEARRRAAARFGGVLPQGTKIGGVPVQYRNSLLTRFINGEGIDYNNRMTPDSLYSQLRLFFRGFGMAETEIDSLIEAAVFEERGWDKTAATAKARLLLEARRRAAARFGGVLPRDTKIGGVPAQNRDTPLTRFINGEGIDYNKNMTPDSLYSQLRLFFRGFGMAETKIDSLIEAAVFEERGWDKTAATAKARLLLEVRRRVALRFGGVLPNDTKIDGVKTQVKGSTLTRFINGEGIDYNNRMTPDSLYSQLRLFFRGFGMAETEIDSLIEAAVFEERGWEETAATAKARLLLEARRRAAARFGGVLPQGTKIGGVPAQHRNSLLTRFINGENVKYNEVFYQQIRSFLIGTGLPSTEVDTIIQEANQEISRCP